MTTPEMLLAAGWMLVALVATYGTAIYLRGLGVLPPPDAGPFPPALVLLPVRAADTAAAEGVAACLAALAAQDYPGPWRVVVAFESAADPAWPAAAAMAPGRFSLVAAGPTPGRAQKLHNLLAGLATRRAEETLLVTLDADTRPPPGWLAALTLPVRRGKAEAASGYIWVVGEGLPARVLSLAVRGIATLARWRRLNIASGSSTALSAAALDRLDLPRLWEAAVSDDMTVTLALRRARMPPWTPRRVLVPTPVAPGWAEVAAFGRRQYQLVRLHLPGQWALAGLALLLPVAGAAACLLAASRGSVAAIGVLAAGLVLQQVRAEMRLAIARHVLPPDVAAAVARTRHGDRLLLPLVPLVQVPIFAASAFGRRIRWAGRTYLVEAPDRAREVSRPPPTVG